MANYSLRMFTSVLNATRGFITDLTIPAADWTRSIRAQGGYWEGHFTLYGDPLVLQEYFYSWLGNHLEERVGGVIAWEGMVYEMDFVYNGTRRRKSLDTIWNVAKTTYTTQDFTGDNLLSNGDFENVAGADFDSWTEGANVAVGAGVTGNAAQLTSDGNTKSDDGATIHSFVYIRQNANITMGKEYKLNLQCKGQTRIGVKNPNAPTGWVVIPQTGSNGAAWIPRSYKFIGPAGNEALVYLWPGLDLDDVGLFDDVELLEKGEVVYQTPWAFVDGTGTVVTVGTSPSVTKYGRKEDILYLDNYPLATATARRDTYLLENNKPWARPVSVAAGGDTYLEVTARGYVQTANWMFEQAGDGADHDLDHWITAMIGSTTGVSTDHDGTSTTAGDCQFLKTGSIASNTLQVTERSTVEERVWDVITELVELGDSSGNPYRCYVSADQRVNYEQIDVTPRYYLRNGGIFNTLAGRKGSNPRFIRPAVVRDQFYPVHQSDEGSFLNDVRDIYVEEVEVDAAGTVTLKSQLFSEAELLAARTEYAIRLKEQDQ